jgi:hypothetical protein
MTRTRALDLAKIDAVSRQRPLEQRRLKLTPTQTALRRNQR